MNRNERALLAWSHGSLALLRKSPSRRVRQNGEQLFPSQSGDADAGKRITHTLSKFSHISSPHVEAQSFFTSLAGEKCFVYSIQPWRIAD